MAEAFPVNVQAFAPFKGGGKRFAVSSSSVAFAIPGLAGGAPVENGRVVVSNSGSVAAYIQFGDQTAVATTDFMEILAGCAYLLTPPFTGLGGVYIAAITEGGATKLSVIAGVGT